jgi:16S rRNA processing protein RimM
MAGDNPSKPDTLLKIGFIKKPHGLKGEIKVLPLTDRGEQFTRIKNCYLFDGNSYNRARINAVRVTPADVILKLQSYNDRNGADTLRGYYIYIEREFGIPLEKNEYYVQDLAGCTIISNDCEMGTVKDLYNAGAGDILIIEYQGREVMIPMVHDFIDKIDLGERVIRVSDIDGFYS